MKNLDIETISKTSQELSKHSSLDPTSVFIIVALVAFVGMFILLVYKIICNQHNLVIEKIRDLQTQMVESFEKSESIYNLETTSLISEIKKLNTSCTNRNQITKKIVDDSLNYLNTSIENLFNAVTEILGEGLICSTSYALKIFGVIMEVHCYKKAIRIYEKVRVQTVTPISQTLKILSTEFRQITEEEKELLDKIKYTNNHILGEELTSILDTSEWDEFIDCKVKPLIEQFNNTNPNFIDVKDVSISMFMPVINKMKLNIQRKGGLL